MKLTTQESRCSSLEQTDLSAHRTENLSKEATLALPVPLPPPTGISLPRGTRGGTGRLS